MTSETNASGPTLQIRDGVTRDAITRFQLDILAAVAADEPVSGVDIRDVLEAYYGFGDGEGINNGRLYPNLDALIEVGLLTKADGPDDRTNHYGLTDAGRQQLTDRVGWLQTQVTSLEQGSD